MYILQDIKLFTNFHFVLQGAEKIADSLKQNRTIKTLDLVRSHDSLYFSSPTTNLRWTTLFWWVYLQGGNNIHGEGISKLAQALKDNDAITTVSYLSFEIV